MSPGNQIKSSTKHPTRRSMGEGAWEFALTGGKPGRLFHKFMSIVWEFWPGESLLVDGSNRMTGHIRLNRPVWDDLQVPVTQVKLAGVSDPIWVAYRGGRVLAFAKNADNILYFNAQIPHRYREGADIEFHIHTVHPDGGAGNSIWNFTYSWANIGEDFPVETAEDGVVIASPEDADKHEMHEILEPISGIGKSISSVLLCSLQREGTAAAPVADDYDDAVYLAALDFHIPVDSMGSALENVK